LNHGENRGFHQRHAGLKAPLAPNEEVVEAFREAIKDHNEQVLMLGITPSLLAVAGFVIAVDRNEKLIASSWPGDTERRKAIAGNWLELPLRQREFTACIGDGSLAGIPLSQYETLFGHLARVMIAGGQFAVRLYETPEHGETVVQVRAQTMAGKIAGFHAFKWRLAMAIVSEAREAALPVARIHEIFQREFPDRAALYAATGWSSEQIAEIDFYSDNPVTYHFPTRREVLAALPKNFLRPRFVTSGTYELAERCPILVADFTP
jgi:hypothetical protein